jgi:hypothetical protein
MTLRLGALLVSLSIGCGDDTMPMPMDMPEASWPTPRQWGAGARFGYATIAIRTKLPSDLMAMDCMLDAQLADATAAGMLAQTDSEGECVVTTASDFIGLGPDPAPACAGSFAFVRASGTTRYTVCADSAFPNPFDLDCAEFTGTDVAQVTSGEDGVEGDVLLSLDLAVSRPNVPVVTTPMPQGPGSALWPPPGDLLVRWQSADAGAAEIVIGPVSEGGERVRCLTADDGEFAIPARFADRYRSATAAVEVRTINQAEDVFDGYTFRLSYTVSTAIHLFNE